MGKIAVIEANYLKKQFNRYKEYRDTDPNVLSKVLEHKKYVPSEQIKTLKLKNKLISTFLTLRIKDVNELVCWGKESNELCIKFNLTHKNFDNNNNSLAFIEPVKKALMGIVPASQLSNTYLDLTGVLNTEKSFGIHYTLYVSPEIADTIIHSNLTPDGVRKNIFDLLEDPNLSEVSKMVIKNYKSKRR